MVTLKKLGATFALFALWTCISLHDSTANETHQTKSRKPASTLATNSLVQDQARNIVTTQAAVHKITPTVLERSDYVTKVIKQDPVQAELVFMLAQ